MHRRARIGVWGLAAVLAAAMAAADLAPERIPLPEIACSAPETAEVKWPKIGHERHAVIVVEGAGCAGTLLAGQQALGRIAEGGKPVRFDFAEQLRLAAPPALSFRPSEAGFGEVRLSLVVTPRVYFYSLRRSGGTLTLTARNTLDNTADLFFRVEVAPGAAVGVGGVAAAGAGGVAAAGAGGVAAVERADNLGPNLERDYSFALPGLKRGDVVRVSMEKAQEALEAGYRYTDSLRIEK